MKKIAIIGPYPLPYGGISIHIKRVVDYLDKKDITYDLYVDNYNNNYQLKMYQMYGSSRFFSLLRLLFSRYDIIHYHSSNCSVRIVLAMFSLFKKGIYLHVHGASLKDTFVRNSFKSNLLKCVIKFPNLLVDNVEIKKIAEPYHKKQIDVIDAFLPPTFKMDIYEEFLKIVKYKQIKEKKIISMVGWFAKYNNEDLYGFDLAVEMINSLKDKYNILLIVSINGIQSEEIYNKIIKSIKDSGLENDIVFIYENLDEIWPLFLVSDVFIRPTNTDGAALSIKEALWFEVPVIASDCIPRDGNIILFENRNSTDLIGKVENFLSRSKKNIEERIKSVSNKELEYDLFSKIYKIY